MPWVLLVIEEGLSLQEAVVEAREKAKHMKEEGVDQAALDAAAAEGFGNALFDYDEDEMSQVVEEFYPCGNQPDNSSVVSKLREDLDSARSVFG